MTKEKSILMAVVLILIGAGAGYLAAVKKTQRLGNPGLKMVQEDVFDQNTNVIGKITVALPRQILDGSSYALPVTTNETNWLPKDTTYARRRYIARDGFPTEVSIVLMGQDRTSIHKPEICLTGQGWRIDSSELLTVPMTRPHPYDLPVMKLIATIEGKDASGEIIRRRAVFVYWFVSENRLTAQHRERVWWMAKDLITTGVLQRWAYVAFLSVCPPGQEEAAFDRMKQLMAASVPEFQLVSGPPKAGAAPVTAAALR